MLNFDSRMSAPTHPHDPLHLRPLHAARSQDALLGISPDPRRGPDEGTGIGRPHVVNGAVALQLLAISVVALCVASFFMHRRLIK